MTRAWARLSLTLFAERSDLEPLFHTVGQVYDLTYAGLYEVRGSSYNRLYLQSRSCGRKMAPQKIEKLCRQHCRILGLVEPYEKIKGVLLADVGSFRTRGRKTGEILRKGRMIQTLDKSSICALGEENGSHVTASDLSDIIGSSNNVLKYVRSFFDRSCQTNTGLMFKANGDTQYGEFFCAFERLLGKKSENINVYWDTKRAKYRYFNGVTWIVECRRCFYKTVVKSRIARMKTVVEDLQLSSFVRSQVYSMLQNLTEMKQSDPIFKDIENFSRLNSSVRVEGFSGYRV